FRSAVFFQDRIEIISCDDALIEVIQHRHQRRKLSETPVRCCVFYVSQGWNPKAPIICRISGDARASCFLGIGVYRKSNIPETLVGKKGCTVATRTFHFEQL